MKLELKEKIGDGAYSDVYKAKDELGRIVAVKIISPSMAAYSDAIEHAKVLARTDHENVVKVLSIERVNDPKTDERVDAIVMEYLDGKTLGEFLKASRFTPRDVNSLGRQIISGLKHIHAQGLAHGDLHLGNIMIVKDKAKLLDILYEGSLALLSTTSKGERLRRDVVNVRFILTEIISCSELNADKTTAFYNALVGANNLDAVELAFDETVGDMVEQTIKIQPKTQIMQNIDPMIAKALSIPSTAKFSTDPSTLPGNDEKGEWSLSVQYTTGDSNIKHAQVISVDEAKYTLHQENVKVFFDFLVDLKEVPSGSALAVVGLPFVVDSRNVYEFKVRQAGLNHSEDLTVSARRGDTRFNLSFVTDGSEGSVRFWGFIAYNWRL